MCSITCFSMLLFIVSIYTVSFLRFKLNGVKKNWLITLVPQTHQPTWGTIPWSLEPQGDYSHVRQQEYF